MLPAHVVTSGGLLPVDAGSGSNRMARRISMAGRTELLEAVSTRYGGATRSERSRILDEFAAVTGYHRKHAIRLLTGWGDREKGEQYTADPGRAGSRRGRYGPEVCDALIQLWEVADRVCSKRLRPMIAVLLPTLERHGRVTLNEATRAKLLEVSAATIDRLLAGVRLVAGSGRRRPAGFGSAVRRSVPIRTFNDWGNPAPGWVEVDFVTCPSGLAIGRTCTAATAGGPSREYGKTFSNTWQQTPTTNAP